jgi:hypothetical protein
VTLDLTLVSNVGAGAPGELSRLESLEKIDLTGSGNNTLRITASDVLDLSGRNLFDVNGNAAVADAYNQLMVNGDAGDAVQLADTGWLSTGTFVDGGMTYQIWTDEQQRAQLLIAPNVVVIGGG